MYKRLTKIDFALENCDGFTVPAEHVILVSAGGFSTEKYMNFDSRMHTFIHAENANFVISSKYLETAKTEFDIYEDNKDLFVKDRVLAYQDLTQITFYYEDETTEHFHLDWDDEDPDFGENSRQLSKIDKDGNLVISVSKENLKSDIKNKFYNEDEEEF
jgi:hypothetical protein